MYVYTFQEARVRYTVSDINPEVIQSCATGHLFDLHLIGGVNQRLRLLMCRFCVGARSFFFDVLQSYCLDSWVGPGICQPE
jgi:hypothetical protein